MILKEGKEGESKENFFFLQEKRNDFCGEEDGSLEPALYPKNGHKNV